MPKNIELGVRLTADGRGFVGAITVSQKTVRKLRGETDKAAASTRGMAGAMRQAERSAQGAAGGFLAAHGRIAQYAAGALGIHQVARALAAVHTNSIRQEQALAQVEARMRSTGGAAGLTTDEVAAMAAALQDATTFGDEAILEAQSVLLTFRGISRETFGSATEAVLGSPAHAGIDPPRPFRPAPSSRFPRTRGDRPDGAGLPATARQVPPHTRG